MALRKRTIWLGAGLLLAAGLYLNNASWAAHPHTGLTILSHRGVHQTYRREGLTKETCTASRIDPPTHVFLENTLPSMQAAFALGADVIELDVHPTVDGTFAVFHDWTVDCRTEGHGVTRDKSMAELKRLDVGYGYTADGGRTFPFRGKGVGLMPSLDEVLRAFPNGRFLINFKSNDPHEGDAMAAWLKARLWARPDRLSFYGGARPAERLRALRPDLKTMSRATIKTCARNYILLGWTGYVPAACRHTILFVPVNYRWAAWGWPNRLRARMEAAGTDVYLIAPVDPHNPGLGGIDTPEQLAKLGDGFRGGISTDRIDIIGPLLKRRP